MSANKEYSRKSDATRAAKKEFGENWAEVVEIFERKNGEDVKYVYDFPIRNGEAVDKAVEATVGAVKQLLDANAKEIKEKAKRKAEIQESKPIHIPATEPQASAAAPDMAKAPESGDEELSDKQRAEGLVEEKPGVYTNKAGDGQANAAIVNTDPMKPRLSTAEKPTKLVWSVADELTATNPKIKRSEVIAECVKRGIAYGTARTQYQHWFKQKNESAAEPRAVMVGGKIIAPATHAKH